MQKDCEAFSDWWCSAYKCHTLQAGLYYPAGTSEARLAIQRSCWVFFWCYMGTSVDLKIHLLVQLSMREEMSTDTSILLAEAVHLNTQVKVLRWRRVAVWSLSLAEKYRFSHFWIVVSWAEFFCNLLAWRTVPFSHGNYPSVWYVNWLLQLFLGCSLIIHQASFCLLFKLIFSTVLEPLCETVHLLGLWTSKVILIRRTTTLLRTSPIGQLFPEPYRYKNKQVHGFQFDLFASS